MSKRTIKTCSIEGCDKPRKSRGWCEMHYYRWRRNGDPLKLKMGEFPDLCTIEGCDREFYARGWCTLHYRRWFDHGDPLGFARPKPPVQCLVEDCGEASRTRGYCPKHYTRLRRHGDPNAKPKRRRPMPFAEAYDTYVKRKDPSECWEWGGARTSQNYGISTSTGRNRAAHRATYEFFVGPIPDGHLVRHTCDNPPCVNPNHLLTGTDQDNVNDMLSRMRHSKGEDRWNHKLTTESVMEIRRKWRTGQYRLEDLAKEYGVVFGTIGSVVRGDTWKHLPLDGKWDEEKIA